MCETDGFFASRHALIQDKAGNTERCAGGGVVFIPVEEFIQVS